MTAEFSAVGLPGLPSLYSQPPEASAHVAGPAHAVPGGHRPPLAVAAAAVKPTEHRVTPACRSATPLRSGAEQLYRLWQASGTAGTAVATVVTTAGSAAAAPSGDSAP